jgi:hypothetical protein
MLTWEVASIRGIGWGWTGAIWVYNIIIYLLLDPIKFAVRYGLSGRAWNLVIDKKVSQSVCLSMNVLNCEDGVVKLGLVIFPGGVLEPEELWA